jgi:two-component system, NtrC family, response regulator HydG
MMPDRIGAVAESTVVVISSNEALVEEIKGVKGRRCPVEFVVWDHVEKAHAILEKSLPFFEAGPSTLIIVDQDTASSETAILSLLRSPAAGPGLPIVIVSATYRAEHARLFLDAGAADYLSGPLDHGKLACLMDVLVTRASQAIPGASVPTARRPTGAFKPETAPPVSVGPDILELLDQLRRIIPQDTNLLFVGEPGTGKKRLARLVHDLSPRRAEPFLVVHCGAWQGPLLESELFGHLDGAFAGAQGDRAGKLTLARKGTLVLDEVGALPLSLQGKLRHAIEERSVEPKGADVGQPLGCRLMATTNTGLENAVAAGRFRADLFYRLNIVSFRLPSLRERPAAVAALAHTFLDGFTARHRPSVQGLSAEALQALESYSWPGNVRQLRRVVEHAAALCTGPEVQLADLPEAIRNPLPQPGLDPRRFGRMFTTQAARTGTLAQSKAEAEMLRITQALRAHGNNRVRAAAELGISRMSLYKKLQKYGLLRMV